ncbi:hypothetical protein BDY19DRAFT_126103 [Irpex rosettiformis]|uniref:Uncharacterized protein n=1 Tax=Irpex rosettiformis TaxID=378272 RepID=A0ACB8U4L4_9APHY|nr:hypothetical protein BDY19DRAFT_126103 [Irpex rosettiformis]
MEELVNDEGVDLESLQAQIDLSLAQTQNLVASWLKPSKGASSSTSSFRINQELEIQELMKGPARLGVGAPIPAATGTLGHETMKLKGKLIGKKRTREAEDVGNKMTVEPSDDEEESRAGAIKKKTRVDPFALKGRKKQPGNNSLQMQEKTSQPTRANLSPPKTPPRVTSPSAQAQTDAMGTVSPVKATDEISPGSPTKIKKKKKKHKGGNREEGNGNEDGDIAVDPEHGTIISPARGVTKPSLTADQDGDRHGTPPLLGSTKSKAPETPVASSHTPQTTQVNATATPKPNGEVNRLPLLNLEGPPPTFDTSPAKKKRKRNKKKKKRQMEGVQAQQSADRNAEVQDEEEDDE